jgi:hypothetical protein
MAQAAISLSSKLPHIYIAIGVACWASYLINGDASGRPGYSPAIMRSTAIIAQGINKLLACAALNPRAPQTANGSAPEIT